MIDQITYKIISVYFLRNNEMNDYMEIQAKSMNLLWVKSSL